MFESKKKNPTVTDQERSLTRDDQDDGTGCRDVILNKKSQGIFFSRNELPHYHYTNIAVVAKAVKASHTMFSRRSKLALPLTIGTDVDKSMG